MTDQTPTETPKQSLRRMGPDIRAVKPTRVILDLKMTIDGGEIVTSQELSDVLTATMKAFRESSHRAGLGYTWVCEISLTTPKRMDARIEKTKLTVHFPTQNSHD